MKITFQATGTPRAQGSHVPFISKTTGKIIIPNAPLLLAWREMVEVRARMAMVRDGYKPTKGAYSLCAQFSFRRPKAHYRTGRYERLLKPCVPEYHTQVPDLDKLLRAICDAMTGVVYTDDSNVCLMKNCRKLWADRHKHLNGGVYIIVQEL